MNDPIVATDQGTEGVISITIKTYEISAISAEPVLCDTVTTPYIHWLAYVLQNNPGLIFWEDETTMLLYNVPSDIHAIAILACELAHKEDEKRTDPTSEKEVARVLEEIKRQAEEEKVEKRYDD
jgi:hypothetical protein